MSSHSCPFPRIPRKEMVWLSLLDKYELKGKTVNEIISLLGEPGEKLDEPVLEYVYYIGRAGLGLVTVTGIYSSPLRGAVVRQLFVTLTGRIAE
jgi:hypothetical protein